LFIPTTIAAVGVETGIVAAVLGSMTIGASTIAVRARRSAEAAVAQLERVASHDLISNLPNRNGLRAWLEADLATTDGKSTDVGLLLVDLDRIRQVNDTFGREVGDQLIRAVADRIRSVIGTGDRLARYGGDEFVLICTGLTGTSGLSKHAARLIRLVQQPYSIGGQTIRVGANIGAVLASGTTHSAAELIHQADVARFQANTRGTGQVVVYEPSMSDALSPTNAEALVREALQNEAFRLVYQPVVNLRSGKVIGAEALIRWESPERGTLSPDEFIPVLEESGLIVPVGTWALQEACREAARLRDLMDPHATPTITVNVSARQLAHDGFADTVASALRSSGADEHQICLEITEGALMHDVESAWAALRQTKALGVRLALDDFGTGYSSLSYVRRFSLDMLKIDKSFIDGLDTSTEDRAIVEHVIGLADALGMATVAEGVERPEQLAWLRRLGCQMAQGYALSRPLPHDELEELVLRRTATPFNFDDDGHSRPSSAALHALTSPDPERSPTENKNLEAEFHFDPRKPTRSPGLRRGYPGPDLDAAAARSTGPMPDVQEQPTTPPMVFADPGVPGAPSTGPAADIDLTGGVVDVGSSPISLPRFREYRPESSEPED